MKIVKKIIRYTGYLLFRPFWWLEKLIPRNKNVWVFGAWQGEMYSDNSKWLFEYVNDNVPAIKAIWITNNKDVYENLKKENKKVFLANSFNGVKSCLKAKYVFLSSGVFDVNYYCLNGCKQIWLWHGMPLKKIGYSDKINQSNKIKSFLFEVLNPYTKVKPYSTLTSSPFFKPFLQEAFKLDETSVWDVGLPRCDAFFCNKESLFVNDLRKKFENCKIIFYMPTFRKRPNGTGDCFNPFDEKYRFNQRDFVDFLNKNNIVFLYKPHFMDSDIKININSNRFILINDTICNDDLYILLNNIDALITDYSSVYFDFLSSGKSIFLCPFDYEEYVSTSREHYFNMYNEMCAISCKNWEELYIKVCKDRLNSIYKEELDKFSLYNKGNSSEMIVKRIIDLD